MITHRKSPEDVPAAFSDSRVTLWELAQTTTDRMIDHAEAGRLKFAALCSKCTKARANATVCDTIAFICAVPLH